MPWNISCCSCGFLYAAQSQDKAKADPGYPAGIGMRNALIVLGCINVLSFFLTFLIPEPKGRSLEEISGENQDGDKLDSIKVKAA